jgi:O-antigen biosynthesis protein
MQVNKTSIIILTHNKLEYTKLCIESVRLYTNPDCYELIVVDNASNDGTKEWLLNQSDVITILNDDNVGFPKGCNQGINAASGDSILLLNNDTIVTPNWLTNMLTCLYSSEAIGAVGPVTNNCAYSQRIKTTYTNIEEIQQFAKEFNKLDKTKWNYSLKLIGFCMLIKREIIEKIGLLDERFTPGNFEDDDYSFRIWSAGYQLIICRDTFIHHFGSISFGEKSKQFNDLLNINERKFEEKWGFNSTYSSFIRHDVIKLMNNHKKDTPLKILEAGCGCGGTLLELKNMYKSCELYGVELNESSALIAKNFANVVVADLEEDLDYPNNFFDYIILADVLEHLYDPWSVLKKIRRYLKKDGFLLASIPNITHVSVIRKLLQGKWTYENAGILDRTHIRFFTLYEIEQMFIDSGYINLQNGRVITALSEEERNWVSSLPELNDTKQFEVYQYLIKASPGGTEREQVTGAIANFIDNLFNYETLSELTKIIKNEHIEPSDLINTIESMPLTDFKKRELYNALGSGLFSEELYDMVIPLLQQSLTIDATHSDSLYNMGYFLAIAGEYELALSFLSKMNTQDEECRELVEQIRKKDKKQAHEIENAVSSILCNTLPSNPQSLRPLSSVENYLYSFAHDTKDLLERIGQFFVETGDIPTAREYFIKINEISPKNNDNYYNIAITFAYEENWEEAANWLMLIGDEPDEEVLLLRTAIKERMKQKNFESSELIHLLRRVEFNIEREVSLERIVNWMIQEDKDEKPVLSVVDKLIVNKTNVLNAVSFACYNMNYFDVLLPLLNQALVYSPNDSETLYNMAFLLHQLNEVDLASNYIKKIQTPDPRLLDAIHSLEVALNESK